jgi:hypothetical protein
MPSMSLGSSHYDWATDTDPSLTSTNVHRRHLTSAQKRKAIEAYIKSCHKPATLKLPKHLV